MWPWFDDLVKDLKARRWANRIRLFKPKSCRKASKETFIVKV
jgi:23S rRNA U2552 (ribose-2'-O)-methylase RlmE/FtsJ